LVLLLRKPLLLMLVLGLGVSAAASGRFTARLIVDGALSLAFLPAIEVAALAVVNARGTRRRLPFAEAVDRFLAGNEPWLVWLICVTIVSVTVPPRQIGAWLPWVASTAMVPFGLSVRLDVRFFSDVCHRSPREAITDLLLNRAIGWPLGVAYFFGIAIWSEQLPEFVHWIGF
jgi:hypothetical protein